MATKKKVKDETLEIKGKNTNETANVNDAGVTGTKDDTVNIDLSAIRKKRFRIDGDDSRILYLDTSDFSILTRIEEVAPKMSKLIGEAFSENKDEDSPKENVEHLKSVDKKMRDLLDYTFDSKVSDVCAPTGFMFDLFNGEFRFEHILQALLKLYEANIEKEFHDLNRKIANYTKKYTGKK